MTGFIEGLAGFGSSVTEKMLDNGIQYYTNKNLARQAQANTQKNMRLQQSLEDESWYNRIARSTGALKAAGLSPVLATGQAQGAAAVSHSEGLPQVSAPQARSIDYINAQMLNESQVKLNEAAAEKAHAEAGEIEERLPNWKKTGAEIESRTELNKAQLEQIDSMVRRLDAETLFVNQEYLRKVDEDKLANEFIKDEFRTRMSVAKSQYEKDLWQALLDDAEAGSLTTGALMAMRSWVAYVDQVDEHQKEVLARQVQSKLLSLQLDDNDVIYALSHMPVQDFLRLQAEIKDLTESAKFRKASRELGLPAQAEFMNQQAKTMKNNDFVGHVNAGEYGQAALTQVPSLLRLVEDAAILYALRGRGGAARAGASMAPIGSMSQSEVKRQLELSKNEIRALKQAADSKAKNARLGELYREQHDLLERLKTFKSTDYAR